MIKIDDMPRRIAVGRTLDNGYKALQIDCGEWVKRHPQLTEYRIEVKRTDGEMYFADTTFADSVLTWNIDAADTAIAGDGEFQVVAIGTNGERKTSSHPIMFVSDIIAGTASETPPEANKAWTDKVIEETRKSATQAAASAAEAKETLESIPEDYKELAQEVGQLSEEIDDVKNITEIYVERGKNLLNPADLIEGQWYLDGSGMNVAPGFMSYAHLIPVTPNTAYVYSDNGSSSSVVLATIAQFDATGSYISYSGKYNAAPTFITLENTHFVLISIYAHNDKPQLETGTTASTYEEYVPPETKTRLRDDVDKKVDNDLKMKKICAFGDSIAASDDGNRNTKTWIDYVAEYFGCARAYNRGIGTTTVTSVTKDGSARVGYAYVDAEGDAGSIRGMYTTQKVVEGYPNEITPWMCTEQRVATIPEDTDAVVILAGTNDVGTTTIEGFSAAYEQMLTLMTTMRPNMRIYTCTLPFQKTYDLGQSWDVDAYNDYRDAIRTVSAKMGVQCIDLRSEMGVNAANYTSYMNDNTHFNTAAGRKRIAECVCSALKGYVSVDN